MSYAKWNTLEPEFATDSEVFELLYVIIVT